MIQILARRDGERFRVTALGHAAGTAACAGASALFTALLGALGGRAGVSAFCAELGPGRGRFFWTGGEGGAALYAMTLAGLRSLAAADPDSFELWEPAADGPSQTGGGETEAAAIDEPDQQQKRRN